MKVMFTAARLPRTAYPGPYSGYTSFDLPLFGGRPLGLRMSDTEGRRLPMPTAAEWEEAKAAEVKPDWFQLWGTDPVLRWIGEKEIGYQNAERLLTLCLMTAVHVVPFPRPGSAGPSPLGHNEYAYFRSASIVYSAVGVPDIHASLRQGRLEAVNEASKTRAKVVDMGGLDLSFNPNCEFFRRKTNWERWSL